MRVLATGRHSGILLPCGDGRVVEYDYGDWGWYALGRDDWWRAPATVLWPNPGTLGRRYLRENELEATGASYGGAQLTAISVERRDAVRLLARLDAEFFAAGGVLHNELYEMDFVRHPRRFHLFHDCHDEVAEWLRELGCTVTPRAIRTGLAVRR